MGSEIRKIVVGPDYKNGMNFITGQQVLGGSHTIARIKLSIDSKYEVWIENEKQEVKLWKAFDGTPVSVEFNIDY